MSKYDVFLAKLGLNAKDKKWQLQLPMQYFVIIRAHLSRGVRLVGSLEYIPLDFSLKVSLPLMSERLDLPWRELLATLTEMLIKIGIKSLWVAF